MAEYILSNKADADLGDIYTYSWRTFGEARADTYFLELRDCLEMLAGSPRLGHAADLILPGLRRHTHASHVVFYTIEENAIFVVRVLHRSMDSERHFTGEEGIG
ncbi:MAG: type II toxin-antitoxin system RelE/ParE family toxin [Proteobacteria bacterium]|nr:type II toxin-antitoxin system RelE/ParE family toxin [Pseudomonadota bacterium]